MQKKLQLLLSPLSPQHSLYIIYIIYQEYCSKEDAIYAEFFSMLKCIALLYVLYMLVLAYYDFDNSFC